MKILIIEDVIALQTTMKEFFESKKHIVFTASNKFEAEDSLLVNQFEIILLDITLPDGNGLDLISIIKETQKNFGILILSAKNSIDDRINGLDLGADDYLTKPFHIAELNSRINALLRRKNFNNQDVIEFNEIKINTTDQEVFIAEINIHLTSKEFQLLLYLVINKERVLTKESIADHLLGNHIDYIDNYDFIYTHIKNLRKKIEQANGKDYLKTIHGIGYKYFSK